VTAAGARAVFWLLSGEVLFALLGAVTVISTSDAGAVGFTVANGVRGLTRDFPHSGLAGGMLVKVVLGPAFEELVFRVFLLGFLLRPVRPWLALLISTAVFASVHSSWLYAAFGGLVYGLLYLRYRNVWLCIVAHAANNLIVSTGAPILVAHLHELGVLSPVRENLLALQLSWAVVVLACFAMFLACLFRNDNGRQSPWVRSG
jgi:membrane protease YdiL (CAAX protease family)